MQGAITATLEGGREVQLVLDELKAGVRNKIARKAVNAATQLVQDALKANVAAQTGLTKKAIGRKVTTKNDRTVGIVGPRRGMGGQVQLTRSFGQTRKSIRGLSLTGKGKRQIEARKAALMNASEMGTRYEDPVNTLRFQEGGRRSDRIKSKKALASPVAFYGTEVADLPAKHPVERAWQQTQSQVEATAAAIFADGVQQLGKAA